MIKYLGSKRTLLPVILDAVANAHDADGQPPRTILDLFSGTSRVGHALKRAGFRVLSNDHNAYAHALARCYVQADAEDFLADTEKLVREFNALTGSPGYFTDTFCIKSRYIQPHNGERIDAVREAIAAKTLPPELESVLLVSLMEAADRVDSTTGLQMAYLKDWAPRSFKNLELRIPDLLPRAAHGKGHAHHLDAHAAATLEADVVYIDPPYNQHSYLGNYHMWESLIRWDKPEVYGVACKRTDVRDRRSPFNSRRAFPESLRTLLNAVRAPTLIISFNNEGYITRAEMEALLGSLWDNTARIAVIENDFRRYIGARIGIYNPKGEKVGAVGHLTNKEYLYVVTRASPSPAIATPPNRENLSITTQTA